MVSWKRNRKTNNTALHIIPESLGKNILNFLGVEGEEACPLMLQFPVLPQKEPFLQVFMQWIATPPTRKIPLQAHRCRCSLPSKGFLKPHDLQQYTFLIYLLCSEGGAVLTACLPACTEGKFEIKFPLVHSPMHAPVHACTWITHSQNQMILKDRMA